MLVLAVGIIAFVVLYQRRVINHQHQIREFNRRKQEELIQASIRSEEEERMRIAAELHDDVGATLSSIRLMLYQAARNSDGAIINQARELLDESIQKVRNLSHQLQPGTLQYLGLIKSLQSVAEMLTRTGQITVNWVPGNHWPALEPPTELALYRIVQELLNNLIKHSGASTVSIGTDYDGSQASIVIKHNGSGLDDATYQEMLYKKGAIGLKNIESRLKSARASISFRSQTKPQDYSTIVVSLSVLSSKPTNYESADVSNY